MATTTPMAPTTQPAGKLRPIRIHVLSPVVGESPHKSRNFRLQKFLEDNYPDELPPDNDRITCTVEVAPGAHLRAVAWGHHIFVDDGLEAWNRWLGNRSPSHDLPEPFIGIRVISDQAYTKKVPKEVYDPRWGRRTQEMVLDCYNPGIHGQKEETPYAHLQIEITAPTAQPVSGEFKFLFPTFGQASLSQEDVQAVKCEAQFFGLKRSWVEHLSTRQIPSNNGWSRRNSVNNPFITLTRHLKNSDLTPNDPDQWWDRYLKHCRISGSDLDIRGVKAALNLKRVKPVLERLQAESPIDWEFLRWLFNGRTITKIKVNSLIATMLKTKGLGDNYDKLLETLREARLVTALDAPTDKRLLYQNDLTQADAWLGAKRYIAKRLPGAREKLRVQEAKQDYTKRKTAGGKAEGLGIDKAKTPKLFAAVSNGKIPISVFANPDKAPVNREFALWERALDKKGWAEPIYEIATDASRRSTYEKDITPYLSFLFRLPKYLDRNTEGRKKWSCVPKFVSSQWELEMDDASQDGGTTKRRSAFTPVADNETRTVTVPYVAVAVSGVRTQWCYSQHYYVFEADSIDAISGSVIPNDYEAKLNGRDDYGLMYFTLTGTMTARGYPTFLIIFERRTGGSFVHFHRVHPKRKVKGQMRPACELIEACYQYMAGNVPADEITAQQGDMIYIKHPHDPIKAGAKVAEPQEARGITFESHAMIPLWDGGAMMKLYDSEAKTPKNRLGFLWSPGDFTVQHPEHDDIRRLGEGWYEIRRCRSYENNPRAQWSLTID